MRKQHVALDICAWRIGEEATQTVLTKVEHIVSDHERRDRSRTGITNHRAGVKQGGADERVVTDGYVLEIVGQRDHVAVAVYVAHDWIDSDAIKDVVFEQN